MARHLKELRIYCGDKESGQGFHLGLMVAIDDKPKSGSGES
jgi:hypothetical protein